MIFGFPPPVPSCQNFATSVSRKPPTLTIVAILLVLTAAFAYINHQVLKWPTTIGVMAIALLFSLAIIGLDQLGITSLRVQEHQLLASINFADVLLEGMLSVLLFAGALHVDLEQVRRLSWQIGVLAVFGTAVSAAIIGVGCWLLLGVCGMELPLVWCLLFGALISPTDPIAVLGVLESAHAPADVETTIAGESLINDGVGVVLFALLLDMLQSGVPPTVIEGVQLFAREALGGVLLGVVIGLFVNRLLASIDDYRVEVLITLATVVGGYALARELHTSGPLAMVAVGLLIGNQGRLQSMSDITRKRVDLFWQMLDEILNSAGLAGLVQAPGRVGMAAHLEWRSRRDFGGPGAVTAGGAASGCRADADLLGRRLHDPRAGSHRSSARPWPRHEPVSANAIVPCGSSGLP